MTLKKCFDHQIPVMVESLERDLPAIGRSRTAFAEALDAMRPLEQEYEAAIFPIDPDDPHPAMELDLRTEAQEHLKVLREGSWNLGYRDSRLAAFEGGPGINHLIHWLSMCDEIIAHETRMRSMTWPATFRYIGQPGVTRIDGRLLRVGDTALLPARSRRRGPISLSSPPSRATPKSRPFRVSHYSDSDARLIAVVSRPGTSFYAVALTSPGTRALPGPKAVAEVHFPRRRHCPTQNCGGSSSGVSAPSESNGRLGPSGAAFALRVLSHRAVGAANWEQPVPRFRRELPFERRAAPATGTSISLSLSRGAPSYHVANYDQDIEGAAIEEVSILCRGYPGRRDRMQALRS